MEDNNFDIDYDNNNGGTVDVSPLLNRNRQLRYTSIDCTPDCDESDDADGSEEGVLNTTVDTVENPVA